MYSKITVVGSLVHIKTCHFQVEERCCSKHMWWFAAVEENGTNLTFSYSQYLFPPPLLQLCMTYRHRDCILRLLISRGVNDLITSLCLRIIHIQILLLTVELALPQYVQHDNVTDHHRLLFSGYSQRLHIIHVQWCAYHMQNEQIQCTYMTVCIPVQYGYTSTCTCTCTCMHS